MLCFPFLTNGKKQLSLLTDKDWKDLLIYVFNYTTDYHHTKNKLVFFRRILENIETTKFSILTVIIFLSSNLCRFLESLNIDNCTLVCTKWLWSFFLKNYSWSMHWGNDFPKLENSGGRWGLGRSSLLTTATVGSISLPIGSKEPKIWK